eukprot:CAMPEP_0179194182 /NCGR_PEP_ID=MMETSP0796-20121207/96510_1 /TAXON_ID=73915 /ORGANISM="Pyrodinium bahamense, Strain pbaha01" /LENGTH=127 /DNA_ID=CAMNT_0020898509 /DNA_START=273 /DNA_END=651 /DNA_ORIENTATION=+
MSFLKCRDAKDEAQESCLIASRTISRSPLMPSIANNKAASILMHSLEDDLAVTPQVRSREVQGTTVLLHGTEHDLAVGLHVLGGELQGSAALPHGLEHDLAKPPGLCRPSARPRAQSADWPGAPRLR